MLGYVDPREVSYRREVAVASLVRRYAPNRRAMGDLAYSKCISRVTCAGSAVLYTTGDYCIVLINARDRN